MYERFSGCRVLSYCVMTNLFHLLLKIPPLPPPGAGDEMVAGVDLRIPEEELIRRLGGLYSRKTVSGVAAEIAEARKMIAGDWEGFAATLHPLVQQGEWTSRNTVGRALSERHC
jgi:hypothetical protein